MSVDTESVEAFANSWALDDRARETLLSLDAHTAQRVMASFTPKDTSRGASAAFMGFVKGVVARGGGAARDAAPSDPSALADFAQSWQLDQKAQEMLFRLDAATAQRVMSDFSPSDTSRGASAAFMSFARSASGSVRQPLGGHNGGGYNAGAGAILPALENSPSFEGNCLSTINAFVNTWALDEKAQDTLLKLEPDQRARVMSQFNPPDVSRGASAAFMGFCKSVAGRTAAIHAFGGSSPGLGAFDGESGHSQAFTTVANTGDPTIDAFCNSWGLDSKAVELLVSLDPETQSRIMNGFTPKDVTRGASAAFMGFVRGLLSGTGKGAQSGWQNHGGAALPMAIGDPAIQEFVETWQLDASAQNALTRLDPSTQVRVMTGFAPKDVSRGASAAFMGFVRSVSGTVGHGGPAAHLAFTPGVGGGLSNAGCVNLPEADLFVQQPQYAQPQQQVNDIVQRRITTAFGVKATPTAAFAVNRFAPY